MKIPVKNLIELIVKQVIEAIIEQGGEIDFSGMEDIRVKQNRPEVSTSFEIDMSRYKTPVLTESLILEAGQETIEIIIPEKTIITPGARDIIKKKKLIITYKINN